MEFAGSAQPFRFVFGGISGDVWVVMLLLSRSPSFAADFECVPLIFKIAIGKGPNNTRSTNNGPAIVVTDILILHCQTIFGDWNRLIIRS